MVLARCDMDNPESEVTVPKDELRESQRVQLSFLQARTALHGTRLWQLPLTFLGLLALGVSGLSGEEVGSHVRAVFGVIAIFGGILLWCMYGAREGYHRAAGHMIRLEEELGLEPSTEIKQSHSVPYFGLLIFGIMASVIAAALV